MSNLQVIRRGDRESRLPITAPNRRLHVRIVASLLVFVFAAAIGAADFPAVQAVFQKHCLDCHAEQDPEGKLVLESFETLSKGGETGPSFVAGNADESLLIRFVEGRVEKDGKKKIMPPGKREKLTADEIALLREWISAGAKPPEQVVARVRELNVPKIAPRMPPRFAIHAIAYSPGPKLLAFARPGNVEIRSADSRALIRKLPSDGNVHALVFSPDGSHLFAGGGVPGVSGEVRQWKISDGTLIRTIDAHTDAVYSLALSPDGKTLATGSYDQKIKLWNTETAAEIKTLSGHNGCIFDLAFRPDGKILASASADRTVKLWDAATGERRDTLSQPLKEQLAVLFSPDGKRLYAAGADNRIRAWEISEKGTETTNPILFAKFAHEGSVLKLAITGDGKTLVSSADDRTVKVWTLTDEMTERFLLPKQSDWAPALALLADHKTLVVGRLDGSSAFYDASNGKPIAPPKPEVARVEPRGVQRGTTAKLKLTGKHLAGSTGVKFSSDLLKGELVREPAPQDGTVSLTLTSDPKLARGTYELWLTSEGGESAHVKFFVDDLPQVHSQDGDQALTAPLPSSVWGMIEKPGDADAFHFKAAAGEKVVLDVHSMLLGSKLAAMIEVFDGAGRLLASSNGFDGGDPLIDFSAPSDGVFRVQITDRTRAGSPDHFYRVSIGALPIVTGVYPLGVKIGTDTDVELVGFNLPADAKVKMKAEHPGEIDVPIDPEKFRSRRTFKVIATDANELVEIEPNDTPERAMHATAPFIANGRIWPAPMAGASARDSDADLLRFESKAGQHWIVETEAARRGSPVDTKVEVLHVDGRPVQRALLQAVRDSRINFRSIDSNGTGARLDNYEEMQLNEFLYMNGEVVRLFRMPQGPDSDMLFYSSNGKRRAYFDTSAAAHALDESGYIVQPHSPGAKLVATGLPTFALNFQNDDDGLRRLGTDSKLHFVSPADGAYLVRVTDTRGLSGDRFAYRLSVREPRPDFSVTLNGADPTVNKGSGREFTVSVQRQDDFEDEIRVEITGVPPGFTVTSPLVIEAGHTEAKGTLFAAADAPKPANDSAAKVTATAAIAGKSVTKDVNSFGKIVLGDKPKLFVELIPAPAAGGGTPDASSASEPDKPFEITIAPGQTVPALIRIRRNGHDDLVTFTVENLPHGIIVDNIGLNGVLIPKGETEREIFLMAARWVQETDRLCYAIENQAGRQTSRPVLLHVRRAAAIQTSSAK